MGDNWNKEKNKEDHNQTNFLFNPDDSPDTVDVSDFDPSTDPNVDDHPATSNPSPAAPQTDCTHTGTTNPEIL